MLSDAKDVIISIKAEQRTGEPDSLETLEFVTEGTYKYNDGEGEFSYEESEITGMEGTKTSFVFGPAEITLVREGMLNSRMVFKQGIKSTFVYNTPYGTTTMGLDTRCIKTQLGPGGGDMVIDYVVDFDHAMVGYNSFKIKVIEQG